jgi:hypothetical protein
MAVRKARGTSDVGPEPDYLGAVADQLIKRYR